MTPYPLPTSPWTAWRIVSAAAAWPMANPQHARRNALVASTALMQLRQERLDVEEFLAAHASSQAEPVAPTATEHSA